MCVCVCVSSDDQANSGVQAVKQTKTTTCSRIEEGEKKNDDEDDDAEGRN